jgi:hypothetical protein
MDASAALTDPFAQNLLDWKDETRILQPRMPIPEKDFSKQPRSDKKVKQNRENKNVLSRQVK